MDENQKLFTIIKPQISPITTVRRSRPDFREICRPRSQVRIYHNRKLSNIQNSCRYGLHSSLYLTRESKPQTPAPAGQQTHQGDRSHRHRGAIQEADGLAIALLVQGLAGLADKGFIHQAAEVGGGAPQTRPPGPRPWRLRASRRWGWRLSAGPARGFARPPANPGPALRPWES